MADRGHLRRFRGIARCASLSQPRTAKTSHDGDPLTRLPRGAWVQLALMVGLGGSLLAGITLTLFLALCVVRVWCREAHLLMYPCFRIACARLLQVEQTCE